VVPWHNSIAARYAAISLVAAVLPLVFVGSAYDRYSSSLVDTLTGERLDRQLTATSGRLAGFLDARFSQLDTLVHYPGIGALLSRGKSHASEADLRAVVELEADQPDLYGVLLFSAEGTLVDAIPSQAASGPPYWGSEGDSFTPAAQPVTQAQDVDIVGPFAPSSGRPGSLLLMRRVPGPLPTSVPVGWIALHVRLSSLTELMGGDDPGDLFQVVLLTPDGSAYSNVGTPGPVPAHLLRGPQILPGWSTGMVVDRDRFSQPLKGAREVLIGAMILVAIILTGLFVGLSRHLARRVSALVDGSQALASGQLSWRLGSEGKDEIATLALAFNKMAEQLQQVIQSAVDAEKMAALGRFATNVAHEVRNPLTTMKTTVQAFLATEPKGERRQLLVGMEDEIDRLDDTLGDLLTYARPRPPQRLKLGVWDFLERMRVVIEQQLKESGINLVCLGETDLGVIADAGHLKQILMNLILNGSQAMPLGGVLTLRTRREDGVGVIEVSDTGIGMSAEVLARITEPFFTTRSDGTGLGLSISRQLAELNGGTLEFSSAPGQGTTVTLRLPLAKGNAS
jgi:two-component system sensor histidine kinase AtoS